MHGRIITYAEEIAFLDGGERELALLNQGLADTVEHADYFAFKKFFQGVVDSYAVSGGSDERRHYVSRSYVRIWELCV